MARRRGVDGPTEKEYMATIVEYAQACGWQVYHTLWSRGSPHGFPDLVMARENRLVIAEIKSENGFASAQQQQWLDRLGATQAEVYLWRPGDWPDAEDVLR